MRQLKITKSITNRESQSLDKYLQDIGKEELITAEEEVELARKIKQGDQKALEKLTRANLRFVVSVAKQYQNQSLSLNDLGRVHLNVSVPLVIDNYDRHRPGGAAILIDEATGMTCAALMIRDSE